MTHQLEDSQTDWLTPLLKWPGGKRWLLPIISEQLPSNFNRYFEPFLGGGAVYFALRPHNAYLSDINSWLVTTYMAVRDDWRTVYRLAIEHAEQHSEEHYYSIRQDTFGDQYTKAARLLYLNATCWNGLFRVNKRGQFNVPIGTKSPRISKDHIERVSAALQSSTIVQSDFESTIERAGENDFIFADPPYTVKHNMNGFVKYNEDIFSWNDQVRLRDALMRAVDRGAQAICTNANHESIRRLYGRTFAKQDLSRHSILAANRNFRSRTSELLIRSYKLIT